MAEKLYYSMGEVAEMFDVNQSLIRHWESQFDVLKPRRNKKGNRLFSPKDVEHLKTIYHLVKERGMTLDGARRALKRSHGEAGGMKREVELMERLQRIRALLVEVREELKEPQEAIGLVVGPEPESAEPAAGEAATEAVPRCGDAGAAMDGEGCSAAAGHAAAAPRACRGGSSVLFEAPAVPDGAVSAEERSEAVAGDRSDADAAPSAAPAAEAGESPHDVPQAETPGAPSLQGRRRKGESGHKELFAFYEQSLF